MPRSPLGWSGSEKPRVEQREEPVASPFLCSCAHVQKVRVGARSSDDEAVFPDLTD